METTVGIDFLQFSLEVPPRTFGGVERVEDWARMQDVLHECLAQWASMYTDKEWRIGDAKLTPYNQSIAIFDPVTKLRFANLFFSSKNVDTVLVQHTGQGCAQIPRIVQFIDFVQPRIGRLDVCMDVETQERPKAFYDAYKGNLSVEYQSSPTGETFYLGSKKSDKLLRIYRYNAPHERSALLRFEMQYRREFARAAAWHIVQSGLRPFAMSAIGEYPLPTEHILEAGEGRFFIARKSYGDTITWLERQVKPAIIKLVKSGEFDARAWLEEVLNGFDGI